METWVVAIVSSLWTAGIAFAGLWLGWSVRDRVGQRMNEPSVGVVGSDEPTEEPIMSLDFQAKETDGEDEVW